MRIPYIIKVLEKRGGQLNAKSQGVETYEMRLQYPTFGDENYDVLNQAITEYMNGRKSDFLGAVANMDEPVMRLVKLPYQLILRCEVFLATPKFASVAFELSAKMGETNTVNDFCAFNYDPAKRANVVDYGLFDECRAVGPSLCYRAGELETGSWDSSG